MAKSIRSKIKRKHRAEFRRTIGEKAYQDGMTKVQSKLQETIGKDSALPSLTKISDLFNDGNDEIATNNNEDIMAVDAMETATDAVVATTEASTSSLKGENKAPVKKSRKAKMALKKKSASTTTRSSSTKRERPKPRFFCQFT